MALKDQQQAVRAWKVRELGNLHCVPLYMLVLVFVQSADILFLFSWFSCVSSAVKKLNEEEKIQRKDNSWRAWNNQEVNKKKSKTEILQAYGIPYFILLTYLENH